MSYKLMFQLLTILTVLNNSISNAISYHVQLNNTTTTSNTVIASTKTSIIENILSTPKNKYLSVSLNTDVVKKLKNGDTIQIECPLAKPTQNKLMREVKDINKLKSAPVYITTWFKNKLKMHQFIGEYLDRVTFSGRKLKINDLVITDSGVYSCEIIMGTGQIVQSSNLTLIVDDTESNSNKIEPNQGQKVIDDYQSENEQLEMNDYERTFVKSVYVDPKKSQYFNFNKGLVGNDNVQFDIFSVPSLEAQATGHLVNHKSDKMDQLFSTPVIVIISVATISIILILFLYCFYKNI